MKVKINLILYILVIFIIFAFIFTVTRYTPAIGDDVLFTVTDTALHYLDDYDGDYGEKITDIQHIIESSVLYYTNWSGRVFGQMLTSLRSVFSDTFVGVFSGVIFLFSIFTCLVNINDKIKKIKPTQVIVLFLVLFYLTEAVWFYYRYIFTTMYVLACALIMLYFYVITKKIDFSAELSFKICILVNLFGFFTGMQHEMFGAILCLMIFFQSIFNYQIKFAHIKRALLCNIGLLIGIVASVLSPGTFVRMAQSHSAGYENSLLERFEYSFYLHIDTLTTNSLFGHILMIVLITLALITIIFIRKQNIFYVIKCNMGLISGAVASLFMWSFSPYVPNYGLLLYLMIVLILIFKNLATVDELNLSFLSKKTKTNIAVTFNIIATVIFVLLFINANYLWLGDLKATTVEREELIATAIANGEESVEVPLYDESVSNAFTCYNYNNSGGDFGQEYYRLYYEILVVPQEYSN